MILEPCWLSRYVLKLLEAPLHSLFFVFESHAIEVGTGHVGFTGTIDSVPRELFFI